MILESVPKYLLTVPTSIFQIEDVEDAIPVMPLMQITDALKVNNKEEIPTVMNSMTEHVSSVHLDFTLMTLMCVPKFQMIVNLSVSEKKFVSNATQVMN